MPHPRLLLIAAALVLAASTTAAQEKAAPATVQYALFMKILTLDRELAARVGEELVIGVVYQPQVRESWIVRDDFIGVMATSPVQSVRGIPVRCVPIALESLDELGRHIERHGLDALYVSPLRAVEIEQLASLARRSHVSTLASVPAYVENGLAVGVGLRGKKPEILINLEAARAEGADFNAQLLRLARIVNG